MRKVFTVAESQALFRSRNKLRSLQILSRPGKGLPKTVFSNFSYSIEEILREIGLFPVIINPIEGTQVQGFLLAECKNSATSIIEAFHGLKARIIVQEYIKEAQSAVIRELIVDGKTVGAMK